MGPSSGHAVQGFTDGPGGGGHEWPGQRMAGSAVASPEGRAPWSFPLRLPCWRAAAVAWWLWLLARPLQLCPRGNNNRKFLQAKSDCLLPLSWYTELRLLQHLCVHTAPEGNQLGSSQQPLWASWVWEAEAHLTWEECFPRRGDHKSCEGQNGKWLSPVETWILLRNWLIKLPQHPI